MNIGMLTEKAPSMTCCQKNKQIDQLFVKNSTLRSVVVVKNEAPIGHIPRTHFYQQIGTQYGYNLYMGRECNLLLKPTPLIVEHNESIVKVSQLAMERQETDLYDDIIVQKNGRYKGVVSIKSLLINLAETQVQIASFLNPLSHLPGNHAIDQQMQELLHKPQFSLIYFDLDHFKTFNDVYGFKKGDKVLLYLTDILKKTMSDADTFLGHIGGDDFVAIVPHFNVDALCQTIIDAFDRDIRYFYDELHLNQTLIVTGRNGEPQKFDVCSLSVAVVTNESTQYTSVEEIAEAAARVKKQCKKIKGSCYLINEMLPC